MTQLKSKTAVVTGASQGIGKAIATALAQDGANTILAARSIDKLESVRKEIDGAAGDVSCKLLDLADLTSVSQFADEVLQETPRIDVLVNCGGIFDRGSFQESSTERLDRLYKTNVRGAVALTRSLLPALIAARGDIVYVNSTVVFSNAENVADFAATQHASKAFADSIRAEVNASGVRVLTLYVGRTATPRQEKIFQSESRNYQPENLLQPEDVAKLAVACLGLSETAEVVDLHIRPRKKS